MQLHLVLQIEASSLLLLGAIVLLAHSTSRTSDSNSGVHWFFAAFVCGAAGLFLQSERGHWGPLWTVSTGNLLFLLLVVMLTHAIALTVQSSSRSVPWLLLLAVATTFLLSYNTFHHPDATRRVLIVSIVVPLMLLPATAMLLRCRVPAILVATRTLAGVFLLFIAGCMREIAAILKGAHPVSGARWPGVVLIAIVALCILWMDLLRLRAELTRQALTDPLTGLANRRAMETFGAKELAKAAHQQTALTLLTLDIDRFKNINDSYGHMIGDAALLAVADVLKSSLRQQDMASRLGGDEFCILLTQSSAELAQRIMSRINEKVSALQLKTHDGTMFTVSVTIGSYTTIPTAQKTYADLVHASDIDLYMKKQARAPRRTAARNESSDLVPGGNAP